MTAPLVWVLVDDRPGTANQVLGVAEHLGKPFVEKRLRYDGLARLPNVLRGASLVGVDGDSRNGLAPPWPDVVIGAGRRCAPVARWIKNRADKPPILVHIMNPGRMGAGDFDLIAVPHHDCVVPGGDAANVRRITGAPHRITSARLAQAAETWGPKFAEYPRPFIAVLVGGATNRKPFPDAVAADLGQRAATMAHGAGGTLLVTTSRRTGADAERVLEGVIDEPRALFFWGRGGENPYLGFLALADAIVVTGDSVSMCSEACAGTGAVYIAAPEGITAPKHRRLHQELYAGGYAKPFDGVYTPSVHPPLNAAAAVAAEIERLLAARAA